MKKRILCRNRFNRTLLIIVGSLALVLGSIGVVTPVLPTTPFILLAAGCFSRSSRRLYVWLHLNPLFGKTLRRYHAGQGISWKAKLTAQGLVVVTIGSSVLFSVPDRLWWAKVLLLVIGGLVILHIGLIKVSKKKNVTISINNISRSCK